MINPANYITKRMTFLALGVLILAGGFLALNWYVNKHLDGAINQTNAQITFQPKPVITDLPIDTLTSEQVLSLTQSNLDFSTPTIGSIDYYPAPALPAVIKLTDAQLGDMVLLSWWGSNDQTYDGVIVFRLETTSGVETEIIRLPNKDNSYIDNTVKTGNTYQYRFQSYRQIAGTIYTSEYSEPYTITVSDTTAPSGPTNVIVNRTVDNTGNTMALQISWTNSSISDAVNNNIYRSEQAGKLGKLLKTVPATTTVWLDNTAKPGIIYFYTITAVDDIGNESASQAIDAAIGNSAPFVANEQDAAERLYSSSITL